MLRAFIKTNESNYFVLSIFPPIIVVPQKYPPLQTPSLRFKPFKRNFQDKLKVPGRSRTPSLPIPAVNRTKKHDHRVSVRCRRRAIDLRWKDAAGIKAAASRLLSLLRRRTRRTREEEETASLQRQLCGSHGFMKSQRIFFFSPCHMHAKRAKCDARDALKYS